MNHSTHSTNPARAGRRSTRLTAAAVAGLATIGTFALAAPAAHADDEVSEEVIVIGTKDDGGDTGTDTVSIPLDMLLAYFPDLNISLPDLRDWWNGNGGDTVAPGTPDVDCDDLEERIAGDLETMSAIIQVAVDPAEGDLHQVAWLNYAEVMRRYTVNMHLYTQYCT